MDGMTINHIVSIDHGSPGILDFWDFPRDSTTFLDVDHKLMVLGGKTGEIPGFYGGFFCPARKDMDKINIRPTIVE